MLFAFLFMSCTTTQIQIDKYTGNINTIIHNLGKNYQVSTYIVNRDYIYFSEMEPDYYQYFSEDEKNSDITVYEYKWKKGRNRIIVWAKKNKNEIEAFSSVQYCGNIKF